MDAVVIVISDDPERAKEIAKGLAKDILLEFVKNGFIPDNEEDRPINLLDDEEAEDELINLLDDEEDEEFEEEEEDEGF